MQVLTNVSSLGFTSWLNLATLCKDSQGTHLLANTLKLEKNCIWSGDQLVEPFSEPAAGPVQQEAQLLLWCLVSTIRVILDLLWQSDCCGEYRACHLLCSLSDQQIFEGLTSHLSQSQHCYIKPGQLEGDTEGSRK